MDFFGISDFFSDGIAYGTYFLIAWLIYAAWRSSPYLGRAYGLLLVAIVLDGVDMLVYLAGVPQMLGTSHEVMRVTVYGVSCQVILTTIKLALALLVGMAYQKKKGRDSGRLQRGLLVVILAAAAAFVLMLFSHQAGDGDRLADCLNRAVLLHEQMP